MCTVVCRWATEQHYPIQVLALRDELVSRTFDRPGAWWLDQPQVIGGRDQRSGGSWCVSEIASGATAIVLNRPERPVAATGAPSRGALPLAALRHRHDWVRFVDVTGMASFNLVLAEPDGLCWWSFDGNVLERHPLAAGTHLITPLGRSERHDPRFDAGTLHLGADLQAPIETVWSDWLAVLGDAVPGPDPAGLLVRRPVEGDRFETVFGQFIAARPGTLRLDYLVDPAARETWTTRSWPGGRQ